MTRDSDTSKKTRDIQAGKAPATGKTPDMTGVTLLDRYRLLRRLGGGGMGDVYLGEHVVIEKKVAVKILHPQYSEDRDTVDRFLQEARSASRIGHANIVDIADYGQSEDGYVFLVMEYLEGEELGDILDRTGRLTWQKARHFAIQICNALYAAHEKNIIHRDLKPGNIFITTFASQPDFVKVIDFGIAKITDENEGNKMTKTGMILGTPDYMSPEQATGNRLSHASDIYSLGIILYEMLTGTLPFGSDSFMGVLSQHMFDPPEPPRERCPEADIPPVLENITLKALAKKPEDRFSSMQEFAETLMAMDDSGEGPLVKVPTFAPIRSVPPGNNNKILVILVILGVLFATALIGGVVFRMTSRKSGAEGQTQPETRKQAQPHVPMEPSGEMVEPPMAEPEMTEPAAPPVVMFSLSVNTPDAVCTLETGTLTLLRDGEKTQVGPGTQLGSLPLNQLEVFVQKEPVILKVTHPDFEDLSLPILFDKNVSIERVLTPRPQKRPPPMTPAMKPPGNSGELLTPPDL